MAINRIESDVCSQHYIPFIFLERQKNLRCRNTIAKKGQLYTIAAPKYPGSIVHNQSGDPKIVCSCERGNYKVEPPLLYFVAVTLRSNYILHLR